MTRAERSTLYQLYIQMKNATQFSDFFPLINTTDVDEFHIRKDATLWREEQNFFLSGVPCAFFFNLVYTNGRDTFKLRFRNFDAGSFDFNVVRYPRLSVEPPSICSGLSGKRRHFRAGEAEGESEEIEHEAFKLFQQHLLHGLKKNFFPWWYRKLYL